MTMIEDSTDELLALSVVDDRQVKAEEKAEALEHLDFVVNEFREMKMQPSLERTLRHKEIRECS
jgi:hypothetical protein